MKACLSAEGAASNPVLTDKPRGTAFVASMYGTLTYAIPKMVLPVEETMSMY